MGLVGLPNVGKSSTFNLLSKQSVPAENFPFCTIKPHEARLNVPDERFDWLCSVFHPASEVAASLTIYDIAGLVPGAHKNEGLGNAFLSNIQATDGIYHVVRAFEDDDIIHSEGEVHPIKDLNTIYHELRLKDVERCEKIVIELDKNAARTKNRTMQMDLEVMKKVLEHIRDKELWITRGTWKANEIEVLNEHGFLTAKPVVYLVNMREADYLAKRNKWGGKILTWVNDNCPGPILPFSVELEAKLAEMDTEEERQAYIKEKGGDATKSMIPRIIHTGYTELQLIHFFTCGEDEVKCWTIREGTRAPAAAGTIHSDFEKFFICAEVYRYNDLKELGSEAAIKAAGKLLTKGKEYEVEDGDIIFFKENARKKK
eukprot:GHVN01081235.1.p1 GENE.GHVN01081235.1~~GHVN01081235.1.p1  ORF type:complete len:393 (-),score=91.01 GHVN01081235.1:135-1250(-)